MSTVDILRKDLGSTAAAMQQDLHEMRSPSRDDESSRAAAPSPAQEKETVSNFKPYDLPANGAAPKKKFDPYNMTGKGPRDMRDLGGSTCCVL